MHLQPLFPEDLNKIAVLIGRKIVSYDSDSPRVPLPLMQEHVETRPHELIRRQAALSHDRIHVAVGEIDIWEAPPQGVVYHVEIDSREMMHAACIYKDCRRALRELADYIRHSLDDEVFHVSVEEVVLTDRNCGESVGSSHLSSCQHDSAQAARGAHEDFVCLRDKHPGVDYVPRAAGRR